MNDSSTRGRGEDDRRADPMLHKMVLGRYRIIKLLGQGGMGRVYLGRTEGAAGFSRPVVIKRVLPELLGDPALAKLIIREARILANLSHTGIVGVLDLGEENEAYTMVLEYVHGYDLGHWLHYLRLTQRQVPIDVAIYIGTRVLEALHYAHTLIKADGTPLQVIHRDISPANVLLDTEGHVRLLDFGIARMENDVTEFQTEKKKFQGKVSYAHPSLLTGGEASPITDTYSAAVVTFQLIAGTNPFRGATAGETVNRIVNLPSPRLSEFREGVPPELDALFDKAFARSIGGGFGSAQDLAAALTAMQTQPSGEIALALKSLIAEDFSGDMPLLLGLEPLSARSMAWQTFKERRSLLPNRVSLPPRSAPTVVEAIRTLAAHRQDTSPHSQPTLLDPLAVTLGDDSPTIPPSSARKTRPSQLRQWLTLAVGIIALVTAVIGLTRAYWFKPQQPTSRYLIIEKNEVHSDGPTVADRAEAAAQASPAAVSNQPDGTTATNTASPATSIVKSAPRAEAQEPDPVALTRTFGRNQARVKSCLAGQTAADELQLQIAFSVDEQGRVVQASLSPAGLSNTAAGHCILRVAKSTRFGPLTRSASFRIPIRVRTGD